MAQTPAQIRSKEKYRKSAKGKATRKRWEAANPEKVKAYNETYRNSSKGKAAAERAKLSKYNISPEMYALMYAEQKGACAICRKPEKKGKKLAVDHCHDTGKVRGLLCMHCNTGLGHYEDDVDRMRRAADYVEVHRAKHNA